MNYANAFNCDNCPKTNDETGCPVWWEFIETNDVTGHERITKECGFVSMPRLFVEVIKASNRPAAVMESMRNEIVKRLPQHYNDREDLGLPPRKVS